MAKQKTYKVIKMYSAYSKKKGSIQKKCTLAKELTLTDAISYVKEHYGLDFTNVKEGKIQGFIYPEFIKII
jgi:hypothetical protein